MKVKDSPAPDYNSQKYKNNNLYTYTYKNTQMAHLQQIATQLMKTTEGSTAVLKQAELYLEQASRDEGFISLLLSIPKMDGVSEQLARIATIYALTYARNIVLWKNQAAINMAAQQMLQFISNSAIDFKYKDQIGAALQYLIQKDVKNIIVSAFVPNMVDIIKTTMNAPANEINYQFLAAISEALVDKVVPATGGQVQAYIYDSFVCLSYLVTKVLEFGNAYTMNEPIVQRALILVTKMLKVMKKYLKKFIFFSAKVVQALFTTHFYTLVSSVLQYNMPENTLNFPLFYVNQKCKAIKLKQLFHCIKSLIIYIITQSIRIVNGTSNRIKNLEDFQIVAQCPTYINGFTSAVSALLEKNPYYKIKSKQVFKVIQEIYNFLIATLRSGRFYNILNELKPMAIYSCAMKTLAFSPQDYQNYYHDPQQFFNSIQQIADLDAGLLVGNEKAQADDEGVDIQIFDTLKTHSANLLKMYIKYIDGTFAQLIFYIINVIQDKLNIELSKNLIFFLLCVLRDQIKLRSDLLFNIRKLIFKNLQDLQIPTKNVQEPYSKQNPNFLDIEYTLSLFVLQRFLILFDQLLDDSSVIERAFGIAEQLLKNDKVQQVPKIIASEIINTLLKTQQSSLYCRRTIQLLNNTMTVKKISFRQLQSIVKIVKQNDYVFKNDYTMLIEMCEKISAFLQHELKKKQLDAQIVGVLWHIFEELAESKDLALPMIDTIKRAIQPMVSMINGDNQIQLQEKIYKIMELLIKASLKVGQFEIQVIGILPKTFYSGKKKRTLTTCFALLQLIIFYGRETLLGEDIITKNLILLCQQNITSKTVNQVPRHQTDCLEGILIIQSLTLAAGQAFSPDMWVTITKTIASKLRDQHPALQFVRAALVSTLALILSLGHKYFTPAASQQLLQLILKQYSCLNYYPACRTFILSFSNLLQHYTVPFIGNRYTQLLDITLTLLKHVITLKQKQSDPNRQVEEEQKQYLELEKKVVNCYTGQDQFQYFNQIIGRIRQSNVGILEAVYADLPQAKKAYMREIINMRMIKDHARVIYKVKGKYENRM